MIRKSYWAVFALQIIFSVAGFCQQKMLSLQDVVVGNYYYLRPDDYDQIHWLSDEDAFVYEKGNTLYKQYPDDTKEVSILSLEVLNTILTSNDLEPRTFFPIFTWHSKDSVSYIDDDVLLVIRLSSKEITRKVQLPKGAANPEFDPDFHLLAFTRGNNLYILNGEDEVIPITHDTNKDIVNGQTVHRVEFGIKKGTFWSPEGNYLAFYRMDETMVTDYPMVDVNTRIATVKNAKYPMAGMTSHEVTLGVYSIREDTTLFLRTGEPADQYLTNICWSPDEKYIYIAVLNRGQDHMKLNQYDARTGGWVRTLLEEKHEKYIEPLHPMYFLPSQPSQFIWQSRKDGYNHLYLYDHRGSLIRQLTRGDWEVTEMLQPQVPGEWIYFIGTMENAVERHIYKVKLATGEIMKLSHDRGMHEAFLNHDGKYFIDLFSSLDNPNQINLMDDMGKVTRHLVVSGNPLKDYNLGDVRLGTLTADDDKTILYYKMFMPAGFDTSKKYPVIVYVYGGPHAQMVYDSWYDPTDLWMLYMAQRGYIGFVLDNRGSLDRGLEFENAVFRQLGKVEMQDQMKGIEYLSSLSYVDTGRIGVHGWSYGGYMTISLMLHHPDAFKTGVAGGPVIDWKYYEVMYGERYMDTPQENPDGYELSNLNNYVENLQGRLLIIHGAMDSTVVWQHSLTFINKCVEKGKLIDYFVYPNHEHNVRGYDRIHLTGKITQYFIDFL